MINPQPVTLESGGVRLEPMTPAHGRELAVAVADGHLWELWYTATPGRVVGSTRYHDIIANIDRVEIGYTWYAKSHQRTPGFNFRSQRAIEALGAKKDGVIRHSGARKDGSPRDTVMYSILAHEWTDIRRHLESRLRRHGSTISAS